MPTWALQPTAQVGNVPEQQVFAKEDAPERNVAEILFRWQILKPVGSDVSRKPQWDEKADGFLELYKKALLRQRQRAHSYADSRLAVTARRARRLEARQWHRFSTEIEREARMSVPRHELKVTHTPRQDESDSSGSSGERYNNLYRPYRERAVSPAHSPSSPGTPVRRPVATYPASDRRFSGRAFFRTWFPRLTNRVSQFLTSVESPEHQPDGPPPPSIRPSVAPVITDERPEVLLPPSEEESQGIADGRGEVWSGAPAEGYNADALEGFVESSREAPRESVPCLYREEDASQAKEKLLDFLGARHRFLPAEIMEGVLPTHPLNLDSLPIRTNTASRRLAEVLARRVHDNRAVVRNILGKTHVLHMPLRLPPILRYRLLIQSAKECWPPPDSDEDGKSPIASWLRRLRQRVITQVERQLAPHPERWSALAVSRAHIRSDALCVLLNPPLYINSCSAWGAGDRAFEFDETIDNVEKQRKWWVKRLGFPKPETQKDVDVLLYSLQQFLLGVSPTVNVRFRTRVTGGQPQQQFPHDEVSAMYQWIQEERYSSFTTNRSEAQRVALQLLLSPSLFDDERGSPRSLDSLLSDIAKEFPSPPQEEEGAKTPEKDEETEEKSEEKGEQKPESMSDDIPSSIARTCSGRKSGRTIRFSEMPPHLSLASPKPAVYIEEVTERRSPSLNYEDSRRRAAMGTEQLSGLHFVKEFTDVPPTNFARAVEAKGNEDSDLIDSSTGLPLWCCPSTSSSGSHEEEAKDFPEISEADFQALAGNDGRSYDFWEPSIFLYGGSAACGSNGPDLAIEEAMVAMPFELVKDDLILRHKAELPTDVLKRVPNRKGPLEADALAPRQWLIDLLKGFLVTDFGSPVTEDDVCVVAELIQSFYTKVKIFMRRNKLVPQEKRDWRKNKNLAKDACVAMRRARLSGNGDHLQQAALLQALNAFHEMKYDSNATKLHLITEDETPCNFGAMDWVVKSSGK